MINLWVVSLRWTNFAGCDTKWEGDESEWEWECEESITKVHTNSDSGQVRVLVYGVSELSINFQLSSRTTKKMTLSCLLFSWLDDEDVSMNMQFEAWNRDCFV